MGGGIYLVALLMSSLLPALIIFFLDEERRILRNGVNLLGIFLKVTLVFFLGYGMLEGMEFRLEFTIMEGVVFLLKVDHLALLFAALSSILWFFTTVYAIAYLDGTPNQSRFFGFFSLCVTATIGLSVAGNLFTFFLFYEFLTLVTLPLVLHNQNKESLQAARSYLKYTLFGGALFLAGIVALHQLGATSEFVSGGYIQELEIQNGWILQSVFCLLFFGVGVKAAVFPLHGWLPKAMAAPAPVSALLHAVAVVKAGAFGVVRIVYEVYGIETLLSLGMLWVVMGFALVTIFYGSFQAILQSDLKKRLAYSTVSQVSYILLGVSLFGPLGTIGGLVHLVHQGVMKITLFFCAGAFSKLYGIKKIAQMDGLAKVMPWTSLSFTLAALGMIGIPPLAGFVTKWYLALGALENNLVGVVLMIGLSALLNAIYFLPLIYRLWFKPCAHPIKHANPFLVVPPIATAVFVVLLGVLALSEWSVLSWAKELVYLEYKQ